MMALEFVCNNWEQSKEKDGLEYFHLVICAIVSGIPFSLRLGESMECLTFAAYMYL